MTGSACDLDGIVGSLITTITRVFFVLGGSVDRSNGPIEFSFEDGSCLLLECGPDGEALRLSRRPWDDPFSDPLTPENAEFVQRSGKWTAFDVSGETPYASFVDARLARCDPVRNIEGLITGL